MNNLKSTAVILVLMGVLYVVYTTLNKPELPPPPGMTAQQVEQLAPPVLDMGDESAGGVGADMAAEQASPAMMARAPKTTPSKWNAPPTLPADPSLETKPPEGSEGYDIRDSAPYTKPNAPPATEEALPPSTTVPAETRPGSIYRPATEPGVVQAPEATEPIVAENRLVSGTQAIPVPGNKVTVERDLRFAMEAAKQQLDRGQFRNALATLSPFYNNPLIAGESRELLISWLDALAARVIYSTEHHLAESHLVRGKDETLYDVADRYRVPWQLLANINQQAVKNPRLLLPGTELKVVPGPFQAEISLSRKEATLFLNGLYAGRFPCDIGSEAPLTGKFEVRDKVQNRDFIGIDRTIAGNDPSNPYGGYWLDLGPGGCLHGSATTGNSGNLGCISFSPRDAADIFGILSTGSVVTIAK